MAKKALLYSALLIALYLGVEYYTGFSKDTTAAANGGSTLIRAFQGR